MNMRDAYALVTWQYQFSISPKIAERRFEELLAGASEETRRWAEMCLKLYHDGATWMEAIERTRQAFRRE